MYPAPVIPSARQRERALKKLAGRRPVGDRQHNFWDPEDAVDRRPSGLAIWFPTLLGVGLAFWAAPLWVWLQSAWGQVGLCWVFPYVLLCGRTELGISGELATNLTQLMFHIQFPLEGLIATWSVARGGGFFKAFAQLLFLHLLGVFMLWLLNQPLHGR